MRFDSEDALFIARRPPPVTFVQLQLTIAIAALAVGIVCTMLAGWHRHEP